MDVSFIPLWITSTASVVGVIYAIARNGSRAKKQNDDLIKDLKHEISSVGKRLDDPYNGLTAIKKSTDEIRLHCMEVSTRIDEQVEVHGNEIAALRKVQSRNIRSRSTKKQLDK